MQEKKKGKKEIQILNKKCLNPSMKKIKIIFDYYLKELFRISYYF